MFSTDSVVEIKSVPRITKVPWVKRWLLGIVSLSDKVILVSDLQDCLIDQLMALMSGSRIVVIRAVKWDYGLLVDEVIAMISINATTGQTT